MGTSLWVGFFLIYQYAWLNTTYNLSFPSVILMLLASPGVIIGIIVSASYGLSQIFIGLLITFVWNILISSLVIFFCRDILNYAELNNK